MSTKTIDINQTPWLSELLAQIASGDEIVFEENGQPVARLVPVGRATPRIAGLREGQGWVSDDFDTPLPDEFWSGRV